MKKLITIIAMLSLSILAGVSTASAQIHNGVAADIPFDFTIGNRTLPAGRYVIKPTDEMSDAVLAISSETGKNLEVFTIEDAQLANPSPDTKLVFYHVGDRHFLYKVYEEGSSVAVMLPKVRAEHQLEKEEAVNGDSRYVMVAASKQK